MLGSSLDIALVVCGLGSASFLSGTSSHLRYELGRSGTSNTRQGHGGQRGDVVGRGEAFRGSEPSVKCTTYGGGRIRVSRNIGDVLDSLLDSRAIVELDGRCLSVLDVVQGLLGRLSGRTALLGLFLESLSGELVIGLGVDITRHHTVDEPGEPTDVLPDLTGLSP